MDNPVRVNGNARDVEVQILLRENRRLREENEILKKEVVILPKSPILKYAIIRDLSKMYSVSILCRLFNASRSGVIAWMTRGPSKCETSNEALMKLIKKCHVMKRGIYGSHVTWVEPHTSGIPCSEKRIARLMKDAGNCSVVLRKHPQNPLDTGHLSMDRDFVQYCWLRFV